MYRKGLFSIEERPYVTGYHEGRYWNGFAMPAFELKDISAWLIATENQWRYDRDTDTIHVYFYNSKGKEEADPEEYQGYDIEYEGDKLHVYAVGAGAWVWSEVVTKNYNIPDDIIWNVQALNRLRNELFGSRARRLEFIATGGGCDYVKADFGGYTATLSARDGGESPDSLHSPAVVTIWLSDEWTAGISINFPTAREALEFMGKYSQDRYGWDFVNL